jgi:hypothetical protein
MHIFISIFIDNRYTHTSFCIVQNILWHLCHGEMTLWIHPCVTLIPSCLGSWGVGFAWSNHIPFILLFVTHLLMRQLAGPLSVAMENNKTNWLLNSTTTTQKGKNSFWQMQSHWNMNLMFHGLWKRSIEKARTKKEKKGS